MPDNAYIDEHGTPRLADGTVDHDEWRLIAIEEKLERLRHWQEDRDKIERNHNRIWLEEHTRLSWWDKLWA